MQGISLGSIAGIPVTVSPWYFALLLYFGYSAGLEAGLLWGACITVSILVHELGHAAVASRYQLAPRIMLHGWGGLCMHDRAERDRDDALIIAAGPAAGLVLGAAVFASQWLAADWIGGNALAATIVSYLLYINIFWSLINLLPLWPLDGGQLFRLLMLRVMSSPARAERITHAVGIAIGAASVLAALTLLDSRFVAVIAAMLAMQNISRVGETSASGPIRPRSRVGRELLDQAETALAAGDHREAARLCHQIRADTNVSGAVLAQTWTVLGLATAALDKHDEALAYLKRAPVTAATLAARARCIVGLEDREAARALLAERGPALPDGERSALQMLAARG